MNLKSDTGALASVASPAQASRTEKFFCQRFGESSLNDAIESAAHIERNRVGRWWSTPVDVEAIAKVRGFAVRDVGFSPRCGDAELITMRRRVVVNVRTGLTASRRRWALAHEIGHSLFLRAGEQFWEHEIGVLSRTEIETEERICDLFAGALLMPVDEITATAQGIDHNNLDVLATFLDRNARRMKVSVIALIKRLGIIRSAMPQLKVLITRLRPNRVTGADDRFRVEDCIGLGPNRHESWIWRNQSAVSIGLQSSVRLFETWRLLRQSEEDDSSVGAFVLNGNGTLERFGRAEGFAIEEDLFVTALREGRWVRVTKRMRCASVLYAARGWSERDVYILTVLCDKE